MKRVLQPIWITRVLAVGIVVMALAISVRAEVVQKPFGGSPWTPFPGEFPLTPAFPDKASRYDTFVFQQDTGDFEILKISGRFPYARYFSFNLYDFFEATDIAALADVEIVPDEGNVNPYQVGQDRSVPNRNYTLWLVKEGAAVPENARNVMIIPSGIETLSLFTRVYRADKGQDSLGGVPLPTIEALKTDLGTGQSPVFGLDLEGVMAKLEDFLFNEDLIDCYNFGLQFCGSDIMFCRINDAGLFPNAHNEYVSSSLPPDYLNKVAVITFTPPTFEDTFEGGSFEGGKDVRYWSLCIGGLGETRTTECLCDDQVVHNPDGTVTICIGPSYLKGMITAAGFNHMSWGLAYKPVLLHRHMLADEYFTGTISNVPAIDRPPAQEDWNQEYFDAHNAASFMGEYCPAGKIFTVSEFIRWLRQQ